MGPIFFFTLAITSIITLVIIYTFLLQHSKTIKLSTISKLPPGKTGWPMIGETLSYVSCPAKFVRDRMTMYSPEVFKTSLAGEKTIVFCGPKANKFLFSNEGKLVQYWLPSSVACALSYPKANTNSPSGKPADELAYKFLRQDNIQNYVSIVHSMVQNHVNSYWFPNKEIKAYALAKDFTFALSCKVLTNASFEQARDIAKPFYLLLNGIFSVPINFPGMAYNKAIKGGKLVREKLVKIIKQRRIELNNNYNYNNDFKSGNQLDLMSRLIIDCDENKKGFSEEEIASKIIGLMFAGFYPTSTTIAFMISNLAEHPHVYEHVYQEQIKIARSKGQGEALTWGDIQKMKYSWNVICETMRLTCPVPGNFREVKSDFTYAGFRIPKGWKIHWTLHTTHSNPDYFVDPEIFDPSRFEGNGPTPYTFVPFGAGPRMCAGKEFARIEMLVFLHNVVTKFKFKRVNPNEKITYNPDPIPNEGLRIYLQPRELSL